MPRKMKIRFAIIKSDGEDFISRSFYRQRKNNRKQWQTKVGR